MKPDSTTNYFDHMSGPYHYDLQIIRKILLKLAKEYYTPFFLIREKSLAESLSLFRQYLPKVNLSYAVKSNSHSRILHFLATQNLSFDVASTSEIEMVKSVGVSGSKMILANTIKNSSAIQNMFRNKIGSFTFDNEVDLKNIADFINKYDPPFIPKALIRIKTKSQNVAFDLSSKFGCEKEDAVHMLLKAESFGLTPSGITFHVGTQSFSVDNFRKGLETSLSIIEEYQAKTGKILNIIDMGGGFPFETSQLHRQDWPNPFYQQFREMLQSIPLHHLEIYAQPGRAISAGSGTLTSTIIGKKEDADQNWLFLNEGVYGCYSPVIFDHGIFTYFPLEDKYYTPECQRNLIPYTLAGPTCDSVDIIARNVWLPSEMQIGDSLYTPFIGAYSSVIVTTFNGFKPALSIYLSQEDENSYLEK